MSEGSGSSRQERSRLPLLVPDVGDESLCGILHGNYRAVPTNRDFASGLGAN